MSFLARIGLAIVHPRWALAQAGDRRHAGRSGSDLLLLVVLFLLATQFRGVFGSCWIAARVDFQLGLRALGSVLTDALTLTFAFLILAAFVIWAAAGTKREVGRAFDFACITAVPVVLVDLVATMFARGLDVAVPPPLAIALSGLSYGWAFALIGLAIGTARVASTRVAAPPEPVAAVARKAGWGVAAAAALGLAFQIAFIARNLDQLRPMANGDDAPALTVRAIGPKGELGDTVALPAGKPVIVDFWATWCGPCLKSMPLLDAITHRHPEVAIYSINIDDPVAARELFDERHYAMTLLADDGHTADRYGVTTIPHLVLIAADGTVREVVRGGVADLEAKVAKLSK